jgi:cytochrome P450
VRDAELPAGTRSSIRETLRFIRDPYGFFDAQFDRYGDPCTFVTRDGPLVITADPELVKAIFTLPPESSEPLSVALLRPFLGVRSLLMSGGENHKRDRKLLTPPFHGSRMRAYGRIIVEATREETRRWGAGWEGAVHETTAAISLDVIVRAVFGIDQAGARDRAAAIVREDVERMVPAILFLPPLRRRLLGLGPWAGFERSRRELDALLYREIAARRADPRPGEDILSLILAARYDDGSSMRDSEVRDQLITLLAAGHETTATALAWALYWTHREPGVAAELRAAIDAVGEDAEPDAIAALPLLDLVCMETLRLHPIVADVTRRLLAPLKLGRWVVPAGAGVGVAISRLHSNPRLYPRPAEFRARRFEGVKATPFEYAPFGGGARRCLGAAFATYEMKLVLATLLSTFELELVDREVGPYRRNLTMAPRGGVRMRVKRRRVAARA